MSASRRAELLISQSFMKHSLRSPSSMEISLSWRSVVRTQLLQRVLRPRNPCQETPRRRLVRYDRPPTANEDPL